MACAARIRRRHMRRPFAGCGRTVVAGCAGACYLRVINPYDRIPRCRVMTGLAHVAGRNVVVRLAGCRRAIVAAEARTGNAGVIETRRSPRLSAVAYTAFAGGLHMVCRFARCGGAVVTTRAAADDTAVIEVCRRPRRSRMTQIAAGIGRDMANRLPGRYGAVMAART